MEKFKIRFPGRYSVVDVLNDNIDINIILENGKVFFATAFTTENIRYLMDKDKDIYFWATDIFIVRDLRKETIRMAVEKSIADEYFKFIFDEINSLQNGYAGGCSFDEIIDMTLE